MPDQIEALLSGTSVSRKLNLPPATFFGKLRSEGLLPDAVMLQTNRPDVLLFRVSRLPELRRALLHAQPEVAL